MEKKQAQELIQKVLQHKFDLDSFGLFISNLLNNFDRSKERGWSGKQYIYADYREHINNFKRLGVYTAPYGEEVEILIVKTETVAKLDRARTSLRNFVVKWLQADDNKSRAKDYALVAFYSEEDNGADWRFSFIQIEHEPYRDEKGKVKTRPDLTPAKRYSYLVGEHENSYTAQKQLLPLLEEEYADPKIGAIENAFSVEKVTDEFFQQYKELYLKLAEYFNKEESVKTIITEAGIDVSRFTKKLLGQIVFLYFLQKKGWLGVKKNEKWGSGDKKFLRTLFDKATGEGKNFYSNYLQFLFYEALAKERGESSAPGYYPRFDCKIPFLNGGLFEADYDWQNRPVAIPDSLFHNLEKNKTGDVGTGIFDVFDRYNFTIKEDEPLEKEVAVDPEMLGKVFENMLDIAERKSAGAYYTPREIVHYMCRESLIHYLDTTVNAEGGKCSREDIEQLIREGYWALENDKKVMAKGKETGTYQYRLPQCLRTHAALLDEKLENIKICDPAIGSGAFPVGLLHEIVNARLLLQTYYHCPRKTPYELKCHAIQENIYGVDIDASAVDIARLRLWLSLVVDEENFDKIEALPNLDYKIVCGNSLIGFPENWKSPAFEILENLKKEFFKETDPEKKRILKKQIDTQLKERLESSKKIFGYKVDFDFKLFFSEVWHYKNGFDLVIGNPPYIQIQKFSGKQEQQDWEKQNFETFAKTGDIYCLFYEKGNRILRDGGTLTFITSNKWMRANYGKNTRKYFLNNVAINQLIDFGDSPIFKEATTYTNILLISKKWSDTSPQVWDVSHMYDTNISLETMLAREKAGTAVFSEDAFIIARTDQELIKKRIEEIGTPLKEWNISINYGIKTGFNEAFIIDGKRKNELISQDSKNEKMIKPVLRGRDIKRYSIDFSDLWIILAGHNSHRYLQKDYPVIFEHLKQYKQKLEIRGQCRYGGKGNKGQHYWLELDNNPTDSFLKEFEKEKIIYAEIVFDSAFYYDKNNYYAEATTFILTGENIKYLTALLNSKLLTYAFKAFYAGGDLRGNTFRYKKVFLERLPIPKIPKESQKPFEILVDYVTLTKEKDLKLQAAFFEQLIDGMVFELYFADKIKAAGKEILKYLDDLKPLTGHMTDEEKLALIKSEFNRLYDPYHPVRNNLETLDSLDLVRTINKEIK